MVEISKSGSGEGLGGVISRGYSKLETDRQRSQPRGKSPTNTVRLWPTELGHLVQDVTRDHGLGHSPASGPGAKPIPENRCVPKERILHPRLERVAGLLLPAAPAERPHVRDRAISRARPRPTPRHPRGLGRWNHDSRVTHPRRFVERDRIVAASAVTRAISSSTVLLQLRAGDFRMDGL